MYVMCGVCVWCVRACVRACIRACVLFRMFKVKFVIVS